MVKESASSWWGPNEGDSPLACLSLLLVGGQEGIPVQGLTWGDTWGGGVGSSLGHFAFSKSPEASCTLCLWPVAAGLLEVCESSRTSPPPSPSQRGAYGGVSRRAGADEPPIPASSSEPGGHRNDLVSGVENWPGRGEVIMVPIEATAIVLSRTTQMAPWRNSTGGVFFLVVFSFLSSGTISTPLSMTCTEPPRGGIAKATGSPDLTTH